MPSDLFRMDRDGVYLEYKGKEEDLAVPPEQLIGAKAHDILPVDVADHLVGGVRRAIDTGELTTGEYTLELDGVPRDFEARIVKAGDEAVLIAREFTERNRAQADERLHAEPSSATAISSTSDFIRTVVDSTPSLLCLVTPGGYILRVNTSLERSGRGQRPHARARVLGSLHRPRGAGRRAPRAGRRSRPRRARRVREHLDLVGRRAQAGDVVDPAPGRPRPAAAPHLRHGHHRAQAPRGRARRSRRGSSRRATSSVAGSSATSTTGRSSGSSRSLMLRLAQARVNDDPEQAAGLLGQASDELAQALEELRRAESTRRCFPTAGSAPPGGARPGRRSRSSSSSWTTGCLSRSRRPRITSSPRRSRTSRSTPRRQPSRLASRP